VRPNFCPTIIFYRDFTLTNFSLIPSSLIMAALFHVYQEHFSRFPIVRAINVFWFKIHNPNFLEDIINITVFSTELFLMGRKKPFLSQYKHQCSFHQLKGIGGRSVPRLPFKTRVDIHRRLFFGFGHSLFFAPRLFRVPVTHHYLLVTTFSCFLNK